MPPIRAPGPTVVRKPTSMGKPGKIEMPPPASVPVRAHTPPAPQQAGPMLIDEITTMQSALQTCVVKSAEIFRFQADAARAGVSKHAVNGSRSAAAALHRSVERYHEAYDSLEAEILRALAVLDNDLEREKARIEAKRQEEALAHAQTQLVASPEAMDVETQHTQPMSPTVIAQASVSGLAARRPSAVSLSSLHHRAPPLRLDLSGVMPMSPVTLAPRTGAPHTSMDFQADFMLPPPPPPPQAYAQQNQVIDLTMDAGDPSGTSQHPIDVDVDSDLFGGGDLESPSNAIAGGPQPESQVTNPSLFGSNDVDVGGLFNTLVPPETQETDAALLNALQPESTAPNTTVAPDSDNILAELQMLQTAGNEGSALADTLNFGAATNTELGNMDIGNLGSDSYDPALFSSDAMPPEMMALMDMDFAALSSLTVEPSGDPNVPAPGGS